MNYKFKNIVHFYLGCDFQLFWRKDDGLLEFERVGKLLSIKPKNENQHPLIFDCKAEKNRKYTIELAYDYDEVKPILRSISQLTDDEAISLCKLKSSFLPSRRKYEVYLNSFDKKVVSYGDSPNDKYLVERYFGNGDYYNQHQTVFLLSIGIDLFDLIDRGIAVQYEA